MITLEKVIGTTFDMIVADGTNTKQAIIPLVPSCKNMLLTDIFFGIPALTTANKKVALGIYTKRGNKIYGIINLDASTAQKHHMHFIKSVLLGDATLEISSDATVNGDKTFNVELRGLGGAKTYMNLFLSNEPPLLLSLEQEGNG